MSANKGLSSRAIIGSFYRRLEQMQGQSWVTQVGMLFNSDQESETYKWLGQAPAMQEWIGGRNPKGFRENGITIANKKFEATLEVPIDWLERDKTGQLNVRIDELAGRTVSHWAALLSTLIAAGDSTVCYDGQFFFDTDHAEGDSGTQSNDITVDISTVEASPDAATNPTPKQAQAMVLNAVEAILGFKDDVGEPMNETARQFLVMVPTPLFSNFAAAIGNPIIGGGDTNTLTQLDGYSFGLAVNPRLTWTDKVAVFRTDGSVKPFILQEEKGVMVSALAEGSDHAFKNDSYLYSVDARRNVGLGYWQHACLVQAT